MRWFALGCLSLLLTAGHAASLPYATQAAFPGMTVDQPVAIVSPPGDARQIFVVEKPGRILIFDASRSPASATVFLDIRDRVGDDGGEQGLLALAFHPDWRSNRQFFVWYTHRTKRWLGSDREDRLARFEISAGNPDQADPASEQILIAQADEASNHNGGDLHFGPDGYLYVSLGDEGAANDSFRNSQRIDKDFFAGVLRLDVDRRPGSLAPHPHPAVRPGTYAVPPDNPFVGARDFQGSPLDATKVRTEFWAIGLRNPWRMAFDPATGRLWCADVGQNLYEEINVIVRGGNYGWDYREGKFPFRSRAPATAKFVEPIWTYPRSEGMSVTGGLVYRGQRWPDLHGKYLFADFATGRIWALEADGEKPVGRDRVQLVATAAGVASFGVDPVTGDILLASLLNRQLLRLVAGPAR